MIYNPANWYWIVAGASTQVWSSAAAKYVPTSDAAYAAWLATGNAPSQIDSASNLETMLAEQFPAGWPASASAQASDQLQAHLSLGLVLTSSGTPALSATYALDSATMDQIGSVARDFSSGLGLPGGASTFTYPDISGIPRTFTGAQLVALYKAQRDLIFALTTQEAVMAQGGNPVWPSQTATIA